MWWMEISQERRNCPGHLWSDISNKSWTDTSCLSGPALCSLLRFRLYMFCFQLVAEARVIWHDMDCNLPYLSCTLWEVAKSSIFKVWLWLRMDYLIGKPMEHYLPGYRNISALVNYRWSSMTLLPFSNCVMFSSALPYKYWRYLESRDVDSFFTILI